MKQLTEKELAPYLTSGIKAHREGWASINVNKNTIDLVIEAVTYRQFKLGLRPLRDLVKEIKHKDITIIGRNEFTDKEWEQYMFFELALEKVLAYESFIKLIEYHFDVFGLIEKGLAIDINTLKNEN